MAEISQPPTVQAEFFLGERDFVALAEYGRKRRRRRETVFFWTIALILFALASWQLWVAYVSGTHPGYGWIVLVVIALLGLWAHHFMPPLGIRRLVRKSGIGDAPIRLLAHDGYLKISSAGVETRVAWRDLYRRARTDTHFFFWFNPVEAFIVPLKSLDQTTRERLWALAAAADKEAAT